VKDLRTGPQIFQGLTAGGLFTQRDQKKIREELKKKVHIGRDKTYGGSLVNDKDQGRGKKSEKGKQRLR